MSNISFDPDQVRQLAAILAETSLTEIEICEGDNRIRVVRAPAQVTMFAGNQSAAPAPVAAAVAAPAIEPPATAHDDFSVHPGLIKSPMVGVVYLAPEPGAPPFITAGQVVAAGQTVLLIEAMKTFNQIKAPRAGTVVRILVAAGAPVEFDEPLLVIE
jgi:acetyl-CoA carboxylase biotin carboxyl carrier protein